jgi:ribosomal protein S18 acetylase RimI-like enzyme
MRLSSIIEDVQITYWSDDGPDDNLYDPWIAADQADQVAASSGIRVDRNKELSYIALDNDQVVGALWSSLEQEDYGWVYSWDVAVDPKYRNAKIGIQLIDAAIANFENHRAEFGDVRMRVWAVNPKLVRVLERKYDFDVEQGFSDGSAMMVRESYEGLPDEDEFWLGGPELAPCHECQTATEWECYVCDRPTCEDCGGYIKQQEWVCERCIDLNNFQLMEEGYAGLPEGDQFESHTHLCDSCNNIFPLEYDDDERLGIFCTGGCGLYACLQCLGLSGWQSLQPYYGGESKLRNNWIIDEDGEIFCVDCWHFGWANNQISESYEGLPEGDEFVDSNPYWHQCESCPEDDIQRVGMGCWGCSRCTRCVDQDIGVDLCNLGNLANAPIECMRLAKADGWKLI